MSSMNLTSMASLKKRELEHKINILLKSCKTAHENIDKTITEVNSFPEIINKCDVTNFKERYLTLMNILTERIYTIDEFNASINDAISFESLSSSSCNQVDSPLPTNLNNVETVSTASGISNDYSTSNECKNKTSEEWLVKFSSNSLHNPDAVAKENIKDNTNEPASPTQTPSEGPKESLQTLSYDTELILPRQPTLEIDTEYMGFIISIDVPTIYIIFTDLNTVDAMRQEMNDFYDNAKIDIKMNDQCSKKKNLICALYDNETKYWYRGLCWRKVNDLLDTYLIDTGEYKCVEIQNIRPLDLKFTTQPPFAQSCHLAMLESLINENNKDFIQIFLQQFVGKLVKVKIEEDNSESLSVDIILDDETSVTEKILKAGLGSPAKSNEIEEVVPVPSIKEEDESPVIDAPSEAVTVFKDNHNRDEEEKCKLYVDESDQCNKKPIPSKSFHTELVPILDVKEEDDSPETNDPLEAVTGYHNRDEEQICKFYVAGSDKCFKKVCNKRHIRLHPDGWTYDKVFCSANIPPMPLPIPGSWHVVTVTSVPSYNKIYVQFQPKGTDVSKREFGVILPPQTLQELITQMNSPVFKYEKITMEPAIGELVAVKYQDDLWYRAKIIQVARAHRCIEVFYVDYGTSCWVKETDIKQLDNSFLALPSQAIKCTIVGLQIKTPIPHLLSEARNCLSQLTLNKPVLLQVVTRVYDEMDVLITDNDGYNISDMMALRLDFVKVTLPDNLFDNSDVECNKVIVQ